MSSIASSTVAKTVFGASVLIDSSYCAADELGLDGRARGASRRSTYFARTSTSRFTRRPGSSSASVVSASVCGISATSNASSCSAAIVSETPSTVIEPFSTQ